MDVILKQDVDGLGYLNDIVKVKAGYGRNFLIPRGIAVLATISEKKVMAENIKQREHKESKLREAAETMAEEILKTPLKIGAKVGEKGKIFGSVNTIQIADAIKAMGHEVDRKNIKIKEDAIKEVGSYEAEVTFYKDVVKTITFEVVEE